MKTQLVSTLTLIFATQVLADVSLVLPLEEGTDVSQLSASILGVGSDGQTTYLIEESSPTDVALSGLGVASLTVVEGASNLVIQSFTIDSIAAQASCDLSSGSCVDVAVDEIASITTALTTSLPLTTVTLQGGPSSTSIPSPTPSHPNSAARDNLNWFSVGLVGVLLSWLS